MNSGDIITKQYESSEIRRSHEVMKFKHIIPLYKASATVIKNNETILAVLKFIAEKHCASVITTIQNQLLTKAFYLV